MCQLFEKSYGVGGYCYTGYDEWHDSKGIRLSRGDDFSKERYDTATLNWNQVQKRVRALIDSGRYLNTHEKAYLPIYEKVVFARKAANFVYYDPNRNKEEEWDHEAAQQKYLSLLQDPHKSIALLGDMGQVFAAVPSDRREAQIMRSILAEMAQFLHGDYSLFAPMPEEMLQAERQAKQAVKEKKKEQNHAGQGAIHTTSEAPAAPGDRLAVAARALAKKKPSAVVPCSSQIILRCRGNSYGNQQHSGALSPLSKLVDFWRNVAKMLFQSAYSFAHLAGSPFLLSILCVLCCPRFL